jgi:hypothetical protein
MATTIRTVPEEDKERKGKPAFTRKWVYLFDEVQLAEEAVGGSWDGVRSLLGGKGAKLPVPAGFNITT